ncbi:hypothetical protein EON67_06565 [archaeon]|nr:MAG: hypothetical protein EON67_06565 [archaeon]
MLAQIQGVLAINPEERRNFLATGGLKSVQLLDMTDADVAAAVDNINSIYPAEVVEYLKPDFMKKLSERMS